jgi:phage gp36-like protein
MYATRNDLEARFGEGELQQLESMQTVGNSIEEALQDASDVKDTASEKLNLLIQSI